MNTLSLPTETDIRAALYVYGTSMLLLQSASQLHCSRVLIIKHLLSITSEVA